MLKHHKYGSSGWPNATVFAMPYKIHLRGYQSFRLTFRLSVERLFTLSAMPLTFITQEQGLWNNGAIIIVKRGQNRSREILSP